MSIRSRDILRVVPRVHQAAHRIAVYLERDTRLAATQAEAHVLSHLASHGAATIAQLHAAFGHRRSTLTSILDRLATRGFITRESSEADRRTFVITLTTKGQSAAREVLQALADFEQEIAARVTASDLQGFAAVVDAIASARPRRRPRTLPSSGSRRRT